MDKKYKGKRLTGYVANYVVFDLETTGVSVVKDDIIEIAAIKVKNGQIVDTFDTLVNPDRPIPPGATRVNGITNEMVSSAPYLKDVLEDFLRFIDGFVLVGHNIQSFDMHFISNATVKLYDKTVENDFIDTLFMARRCLPELSNHKLVDLAAHFQINPDGAHRALYDCMMNQKVYEEMGKIEVTMAVEKCPNCGGELVKRKGRFGVFFGCSNYPDCRFTKNI